MKVVLLDEADEPAWENFVQGHPEATFFHRCGWRRVVYQTYGHKTAFLMARANHEVRGVLPIVHCRSRLFGNSLISTGFCVQGGVLAVDDEAHAALIHAATELGRDRNVAYVELRDADARDLPGWERKEGVYAGFARRISGDEGTNFKAIPRKKRADLRKALASGLTVETGATPGEFWPVYAESLRNLGTPVFPLRFVEALRREFGASVEISLVRGPSREPLAALVSFYFRDRVLPYYGGAVPAARAVHAYDLLYWSLMCRAVARGVRVFDFGRSKVGTGAYDYKRFWGFDPTPMSYRFRLIRARSVPDVNPLNPKYKFMVDAWRRLPLPVANRLGPVLARHLA